MQNVNKVYPEHKKSKQMKDLEYKRKYHNILKYTALIYLYYLGMSLIFITLVALDK